MNFFSGSDGHISTYTQEFLSQFNYERWKESRRLKPVLWHGDIKNKVTKIHVDEFLNSAAGAKRVFQALLDYGVALIEGVMYCLPLYLCVH